jgi:hypothetical protein
MAYTTYFDLVESLIVSSYGGPQDAEQRDIRTAIHRAYDELTTIRDWAYYHVHGRVALQAPYSTGTAEFDNSGLTDGVGTQWDLVTDFSSHPKHFTLRVADRNYPVTAYASATQMMISAGGFTSQPGAYTLFRSIYPLPSDFRNMDEPSDEYNWWSGLYITPDQAMKLERVSNSSGEPYHWTIIKDPHGSGWAIKIVGYPTKQETLDFTYRRTARPIRYSGHEPALRQGTIARVPPPITDTVTGSGTAFAPAMVGSILRVGDTANVPGPIESLAPWAAESKITAVGSATSLTTDTVATIASSTKYLITDPIDIAPHMHGAMDSACDYWLARIRGTGEDKAFSMYQRDLRLAMEQDQLAPISGRSRNVWHDGGWRSPLQADVG